MKGLTSQYSNHGRQEDKGGALPARLSTATPGKAPGGYQLMNDASDSSETLTENEQQATDDSNKSERVPFRRWRVRFAPGPLRDKYHSEDGHATHEGQVATQKRQLGCCYSQDLTQANIKQLELELGEECRPSVDRLKRRVGLLPPIKRPRLYATPQPKSQANSRLRQQLAEAASGALHRLALQRLGLAGTSDHPGSKAASLNQPASLEAEVRLLQHYARTLPQQLATNPSQLDHSSSQPHSSKPGLSQQFTTDAASTASSSQRCGSLFDALRNKLKPPAPLFVQPGQSAQSAIKPREQDAPDQASRCFRSLPEPCAPLHVPKLSIGACTTSSLLQFLQSAPRPSRLPDPGSTAADTTTATERAAPAPDTQLVSHTTAPAATSCPPATSMGWSCWPAPVALLSPHIPAADIKAAAQQVTLSHRKPVHIVLAQPGDQVANGDSPTADVGIASVLTLPVQPLRMDRSASPDGDRGHKHGRGNQAFGNARNEDAGPVIKRARITIGAPL